MVGRRKKWGDEPSSPGWYPDPFSATGLGERYFDGKRWTTNDRAAGVVTTLPDRKRRRLRRLRRLRPANARSLLAPAIFLVLVLLTWWVQNRPGDGQKVADDRPPPGYEAADAPLGKPAPVPPGAGKFEILRHQDGDPTTPVAFDPCRPIHYVVNPEGAPDDGLELIENAVKRVQEATGLQFVYDGTTDERPSRSREPYQPDRYGKKRWAPVLIAWSDEDAYPELAGYIGGVGGGSGVYTTDRDIVYVSGLVVLDARDLSTAALPDRRDAQATILHEVGHLVGLAHTSDREQIMFSEGQFNVYDFGAGDLQGLALLGTQACFPDV